MSDIDVQAIRERTDARKDGLAARADIIKLCDEVERLRAEAVLNARYMGQTGADLAIAEHERDQLRDLARDTAQMFGQIEGSGELYYAPLHRQIDLLAEVAARGGRP